MTDKNAQTQALEALKKVEDAAIPTGGTRYAIGIEELSAVAYARVALESAAPAAGEVEALKLELQLAKESNLAVVRRLQKDLDEAKAALNLAEKSERQPQRFINDQYEAQQREDERLHIQCGGNDGPY